MSEYRFDYYYGHEAEQYSFYRIPKVLFTNETFSSLSCEAKVLYGLMLDRMGLSIKNNWIDEENRVYIYFTLEDAKETMRCGQEKGVRLFAELDGIKGIGLIERKKQGLGKPARIYVKNFIIEADNSPDNSSKAPNNQDIRKTDVKISEKQKSVHSENRYQEVGKSEVKTSEKSTSRHREIERQDIRKTDPNYTDNNKTEINKNNICDTEIQSIHQSSDPSSGLSQRLSEKQIASPHEIYRQIIQDNIDYEQLIAGRCRKEILDEIVDLMLESICSGKKYLRINAENIPAAMVKSRLLKLNFAHIEYVMNCLSKNTTKVHNIRNYLITALYNSYTSISHYYQAEVNHDFYGSS